MVRGQLAKRVLQLLVLVAVVSVVDARVGEPRRQTGVPEDWTHHHVLFPIDYLRAHPEIFDREPRALHQIYRRWGRQLASTNAALAETKGSTPSDWNVNVGGTLAPGTSPAKYQLDPTQPPNCTTDFVVFALNTAGATGGQATMVAFNNIYAGPNGMGGFCPGGPTFLFAYNTSTQTNGRIRTSPVLSLDGKKIAFVESSASGSAVHVLKWDTGLGNGSSGIDSAFPGAGNNASMTTISYTTANNNHSSPWVDYKSDTLYVGADGGTLYKITGIFNDPAGPKLVTTGGWPIALGVTGQITSPIFDSTTGNLFIGDTRGVLHSVNAINPGAIKTLAVGTVGKLNPAIYDAPIVDGYGDVLATSSNDGTSAVVVQASTSTLTEKARVKIGVGSTTGTSVTIYDGDFDNNYYNSQNSGHLLFCGTAAGSIAPARYRMSFSGGILQTDPAPVAISAVTTARCGPMTEYFNPNIGTGGTDFFFWGVTNNCVGTSGCIMSLANASTVTTATEAGGTSAVIVDSDAILPQGQTSNIYFGNLATPQRVNKVQQANLQ
jgi:hypothetical protein